MKIILVFYFCQWLKVINLVVLRLIQKSHRILKDLTRDLGNILAVPQAIASIGSINYRPGILCNSHCLVLKNPGNFFKKLNAINYTYFLSNFGPGPYLPIRCPVLWIWVPERETKCPDRHMRWSSGQALISS